MNDLNKARIDIDAIDKKMAELFVLRMKAVETVIAYKITNGLNIYDQSREKEVILKNMAFIQEAKYKPYYEHFMTLVMSISKEYQAKLYE